MLLFALLTTVLSAQVYVCPQNYLSKYYFLNRRNDNKMIERPGFFADEIEAACGAFGLIPAQVIDEDLYGVYNTTWSCFSSGAWIGGFENLPEPYGCFYISGNAGVSSDHYSCSGRILFPLVCQVPLQPVSVITRSIERKHTQTISIINVTPKIAQNEQSRFQQCNITFNNFYLVYNTDYQPGDTPRTNCEALGYQWANIEQLDLQSVAELLVGCQKYTGAFHSYQSYPGSCGYYYWDARSGAITFFPLDTSYGCVFHLYAICYAGFQPTSSLTTSSTPTTTVTRFLKVATTL